MVPKQKGSVMKKTETGSQNPSTGAAAGGTEGSPGGLPVAVPPNPVERRRAATLPTPDDIYSVPDEYEPMTLADKQPLLKVYDQQRAEVGTALRDVVLLAESLKADLGPLAPDIAMAASLDQRLSLIHQVRIKSELLATWVNDQEDILGHDTMTYLNQTAADIEHMATRRPQIITRYESILAISTQRRQAIADGLSRARETKLLEEKAKDKGKAEAEAAAAAGGEATTKTR
jgi:hypothetical protein